MSVARRLRRKRPAPRPRGRTAAPPFLVFRPRFEPLEDRSLMSVGGIDVILEWNANMIEANRVDHTPGLGAGGGAGSQGGPVRTARAFAIVSGAMYDTFNAIDGGGESYLVRVSPALAANANSDAAVAAAAFYTLSALYPLQATSFELEFRRTLARVPDGVAEDRGVALGQFVAGEYLRLRDPAVDRSAQEYVGFPNPQSAPYVPRADAPGVFQTFPGEPPALNPSWGQVIPFAMLSPDQFHAPPPPELTSEAYAAAYNEVRVLGAWDAETADRNGDGVFDRTPDQTVAGIYWGYDGTPGLGTPPRLYNQVARTIAAQQGNTEAENARLFALINIAMADAGIASWETKFAYDMWRPLRGVRQVGSVGQDLDDGNPLTEAERDWLPLGAPAVFGGTDFTPPFPAYTSGHSTFGGALFQTLRRFYGTDDISFTFTSDEFSGQIQGSGGLVRPVIPRTFANLSQAEFENAQSRIYLGIHWGFDRDVGIVQGNGVADFVFDNYFRPRTPPALLADGGFEAAAMGSGEFGAFEYAPAGTAWAFAGAAGMSGNGSGFTDGNPDAPEGGQVAFLQDSGSLTQTLTLGPGTYTLSFLVAQRGNWQPGGPQTVRVLIDGEERGRVTAGGTEYEAFSLAAFDLGDGTHTLTLEGLGTGDSTAFVDGLALTLI